jgi:hypothetical protein
LPNRSLMTYKPTSPQKMRSPKSATAQVPTGGAGGPSLWPAIAWRMEVSA